jgi:hypothetical protein
MVVDYSTNVNTFFCLASCNGPHNQKRLLP